MGEKLLEMLKMEVLPHLLYSQDISLSDYHLFQLMAHGQANQHFLFYEVAKNGLTCG